VLGLLLLSPFCAEFLIGYQGPLTGPGDLLAGLAMTVPLYGTVAVLIREAARRAGRGWPTILLLAAAFGLVQAGLIDQSLFNHGFTDGEYWRTLPTVLPGLDVDASQLVTFVGGHVVWSFAAPIAVVEALAPRIADRPWLGRPGMIVLALLWVAGGAVWCWLLTVQQGFHANPVRLAGTAVLVVALAVAAFAIPRRKSCSLRRAPRGWLVGPVVLVLLGVDVMVDGTRGWLGLAAAVVALAGCGALLLHWSGRAGWGRRQVLAAAGAALLLYAVLAFAVDPMGASYTVKYASSTVTLTGVLALLGWAWWRTRRAGRRDPAGPPDTQRDPAAPPAVRGDPAAPPAVRGDPAGSAAVPGEATRGGG
jgi:hypothetical protein